MIGLPSHSHIVLANEADNDNGFFADLGLKQILAGYYEIDDDGAKIDAWIAATARTPGIVGAMYTTWEDRYAAMDAWAHRAWGSR